MNKILPTLLLLFLSTFIISAQNDLKKPEKLSVDEIVARHVASIGTPDAIRAASTRVMMGKGKLISKTGAGFQLEGAAQLASDPTGEVFAMVFDNPTYPYEKLAFDGRDVTNAMLFGRSTMLGNYVKAQSAVLKDGLYAGALSARWPLLDVRSGPKIRLEAAGTAKLGDMTCYKLKYSSARSGDLKVMLFFDAATFRHVRTEYEYTIEPRIGRSSTDMSSSRVERYEMSEDFSEFKKAGELILPSVQKISIASQGQMVSTTAGGMREWTFTIEKVYYSEKLTPEMFRVS